MSTKILTGLNAAPTDSFVASGASHAPGFVPDPGSTAGTTRFLREDASWAVPAGAGANALGTYVVQTATNAPANAQVLASLATGLVKVTTTTGVLTTAAAGTDYVAPTGSGAGLTALNASNLSSGMVATARLGSGTTGTPTTVLRSDSTWGPVLAGGSNTQIQFNNAGSIGGASGVTYSSGTGTLTTSNLVVGTSSTLTVANLTGLLKAASGVVSTATPGTDYLAPTGDGSGLTNLNASNLSSGTVPAAQLGTGTANSTTVLHGDGTWSTPKNLLATATDGATVTFDLSVTDRYMVTLGGNRTLALSNVTAGQSFTLLLKQDATGSRTVTWFSGISWPGGTAPTLATTASKTDVFTFICTGVGAYIGLQAGANI